MKIKKAAFFLALISFYAQNLFGAEVTFPEIRAELETICNTAYSIGAYNAEKTSGFYNTMDENRRNIRLFAFLTAFSFFFATISRLVCFLLRQRLFWKRTLLLCMTVFMLTGFFCLYHLIRLTQGSGMLTGSGTQSLYGTTRYCFLQKVEQQKGGIMSFKDILEKWERGKSTNSMEALLRDNGVYNKDAETEYRASRNAVQRRRLRSKKPDDILDIHGFTRDEAWVSLESFFGKAKSSAFEKVLVIHGKGNHSNGDAVLGRIVREFIEKCPYAGESGHEKASGGGSGATWVLLKGTT